MVASKKKVAKKKVAKKKVTAKREHPRKRVPNAADKKAARGSHIARPWGDDLELRPEHFNANAGLKKFKSADEILDLAEAYAARCAEKNLSMTITGMALSLGFNSREAFYRYESDSKLGYVLRRVRTIVEEGYERRLHSQACTGAIFALKCAGWQETPSKLELTGANGGALTTVHGEMTPKQAQEAYAATLRSDK